MTTAVLVIKFIVLCLVLMSTPTLSTYSKSVERNIVAPPLHELLSPPEPEETPVEEPIVTIPVCYSGKNKSYMALSAISENSAQWRFISANMTIRDGLLYDKDDYIGVALGSYFGPLGSRYIFILSTGIELKVVKVEAKSDRHTNNGCEQSDDHSVIELVVDMDTEKFPRISNNHPSNGNFNNLPEFRGEIVQIIKK